MVDWFWKQTRREKRAHTGALSLCFGALLGANLGTLGELPLRDYVFLVILLVGTVTTIQLSMASERRGYTAMLILLYVGILAALYFVPGARPSMAEEDLLKLLATLAIWFGAVVMIELVPTVDPADRTPRSGDPRG